MSRTLGGANRVTILVRAECPGRVVACEVADDGTLSLERAWLDGVERDAVLHVWRTTDDDVVRATRRPLVAARQLRLELERVDALASTGLSLHGAILPSRTFLTFFFYGIGSDGGGPSLAMTDFTSAVTGNALLLSDAEQLRRLSAGLSFGPDGQVTGGVKVDFQ